MDSGILRLSRASVLLDSVLLEFQLRTSEVVENVDGVVLQYRQTAASRVSWKGTDMDLTDNQFMYVRRNVKSDL